MLSHVDRFILHALRPWISSVINSRPNDWLILLIYLKTSFRFSSRFDFSWKKSSIPHLCSSTCRFTTALFIVSLHHITALTNISRVSNRVFPQKSTLLQTERPPSTNAAASGAGTNHFNMYLVYTIQLVHGFITCSKPFHQYAIVQRAAFIWKKFICNCSQSSFLPRSALVHSRRLQESTVLSDWWTSARLILYPHLLLDFCA